MQKKHLPVFLILGCFLLSNMGGFSSSASASGHHTPSMEELEHELQEEAQAIRAFYATQRAERDQHLAAIGSTAYDAQRHLQTMDDLTRQMEAEMAAFRAQREQICPDALLENIALGNPPPPNGDQS